MFSKAGVFALVATLSAGVHALTLNTPSNVQSGRNVTVTWTTASGDQPFSLFLHHPSFNSDFAVANNVDPAPGTITFELPQVSPRDNQYTFRAVNITNINQEFSVTSAFAVTDPTSASGSAGTGATGGTGTGTGAGTATSPPPTGTGTTASGTTGTGATNSGSGTTSAAPSDTTTGNNGAISTGVSVGAVLLAGLGAFAML